MRMPLATSSRADADRSPRPHDPSCRVLAEKTASGDRHVRDAISIDSCAVIGFMALGLLDLR